MQVPFLVTTEKINHTMLGFNSIKEIFRNNKDPEFVFDLSWGVDNQVSKNNCETDAGKLGSTRPMLLHSDGCEIPEVT